MFPICTLEHISIEEANELLARWGHKMGPICRPQFVPDQAHALYFGSDPVALTVTSQLIPEKMGKGIEYMTRENTVELSRLCACRSGLCRVMLRLWREFIFAQMPHTFAVSYQDADLHNGNTYRFDGWQSVGKSSSGPHQRSGLKGRKKIIWQYPPNPKEKLSEREDEPESD